MPYRSLFIILSFIVGAAYAQEQQEQKPTSANGPQSEWFEVQARLQVLKSKVKSKTDIVRKLINDKAAARDEKTAVTIVNELKTEYRDLQTAIREYEEQRNLMHYRFPEKGLSEQRTYERIEAKPLEEMETEFSLEGKVKKAVNRLRAAYPMPASKSGKAEVIQSQNVPVIKDPSRTSIQESQILSK
jgi:hypothetical protein